MIGFSLADPLMTSACCNASVRATLRPCCAPKRTYPMVRCRACELWCAVILWCSSCEAEFPQGYPTYNHIAAEQAWWEARQLESDRRLKRSTVRP